MITNDRKKELVKECVYHTPLISLALIKEYPDTIDMFNQYLPFSTGFEVECNQKENFSLASFTSIPYIVDVNIDRSEQRFRIPVGVNGIICLHYISQQLKNNSTLNEASGIHYHVNITRYFDAITSSLLEEEEDYILNQLDNWNYQGNYNSREINLDGCCWIRFQRAFKTAEIRIGEMTFDYELLIKRIVDANRIIFDLVSQTNYNPTPEITDKFVTVDDLVEYNNAYHEINSDALNPFILLLAKLKENGEKTNFEIVTEDRIKNIIKNRTIKI
jgi:hypothetical protein